VRLRAPIGSLSEHRWPRRPHREHRRRLAARGVAWRSHRERRGARTPGDTAAQRLAPQLDAAAALGAATV